MNAWTFADIPDQTGRTAIVTGANTGIGLETARMLAQKGAKVVMACRNVDKGQAAAEKIMSEKPAGVVTLAALDLSDLDSVESFAEDFASKFQRLDLLIENAGVMVPPFSRTKQGFELQMGTNHFGHFALAGRLLPLVLATPGARIVVVSSTAQNFGRMDFDDLNWERRSYSASRGYAQSKLANMLFTLELQRRLEAAGSSVLATAAHPGWTATELQRNAGIVERFNPIFAMKPHDGALPTLRAATDPGVNGGTYWGPQGLFELRGAPGPARISARGQRKADAARLWEISEKLTGVSFDFKASAKPAQKAA